MKNNITELVFIIDKSGSMSGFEEDTVGGFNSVIQKQKKEKGKVFVSTVFFDNFSEVIHDRVNINEIKPMTVNDYQPGGCTALLDAIGDAIKHIANIHKYAREEDVPEHTVFIITTDGAENASSRYDSKRIKQTIKRKTEQDGWEFVFLAANIDAVETAANIGIERDRSANYKQTKKGISKSYDAINMAIGKIRDNAPSEVNLEKFISEE